MIVHDTILLCTNIIASYHPTHFIPTPTSSNILNEADLLLPTLLLPLGLNRTPSFSSTLPSPDPLWYDDDNDKVNDQHKDENTDTGYEDNQQDDTSTSTPNPLTNEFIIIPAYKSQCRCQRWICYWWLPFFSKKNVWFYSLLPPCLPPIYLFSYLYYLFLSLSISLYISNKHTYKNTL